MSDLMGLKFVEKVVELPEIWSKDCLVSIVNTLLVVHRFEETEDNDRK
jgi:hypothetical protein